MILLFIEFLYAVFQVFLKCHSCLEEMPQKVLPISVFIFSKYSVEAESMPH